jgi:hypothetical protein
MPTLFSTRRIALLVVAIFLASYIIDFTWFHLRAAFPRLGKVAGSVHRIRLLAIPDKGNKTEFQLDAVTPEEDVPCVRSMFPHNSQNPCWYVVRHAKDPIQM